jgi:hypothetical protein
MTDVRPEVLELLNSRDPLKPFHRADGQDFTEAEAALMADATPAERAVAAQARLIARAEAGQAIRTKLAENLAASGVADQHVTRVTEGLLVNLGSVPHAEVVKLAPEAPDTPAVDELETRLGRDWPVMVATEAGLPVVQVREMFGQVPPR